MSDVGPFGEAFVDLSIRLESLEREMLTKLNRATQRVERRADPVEVKVDVDQRGLRGRFGRLLGNQAFGQGAESLGDLLGAVGGPLGQVAEGMGDLAQRSRSVKDLLQVIPPQALKAGVAIAAVAASVAVLVGAAKKGIDTFVGLASEVRTFALRTGASAEVASRFVAVADDYGISSATAANSVAFLGRAISKNSEEFARHRVDVARDAKGNVDLVDTVANLADQYRAVQDPARRAALLQATLGRAGRELIPILEQGGDALRKMFADTPEGQILSQLDLDKARQFELAMDNLGDVAQEFGIILGRDVAPVVALVADKMAEWGRKAEPVFKFLLKPLRDLADLMGINAEAIDDKRRALEADTESIEEHLEALEEQRKANVEAADARITLGTATNAARDAELRAVDSTTKLKEAQEAFNEVAARRGKIAEAEAAAVRAVEDAEESLADRRRALRDAAEDVTEADEKLRIARFRFGRGSQEAEDAEKALRDAREDETSATDDLRDAERSAAEATRDLAEAQRAGLPGTKEYEDAQEAVRDAQNDVERATRGAAEARAALTVAQQASRGEDVDATDRAKALANELFRIGDAGPGVGLTAEAMGRLREEALQLRELEAARAQESTFAADREAAIGTRDPVPIGGGVSARIPAGFAPGGGVFYVTINIPETPNALTLAEETAYILPQIAAGTASRNLSGAR